MPRPLGLACPSNATAHKCAYYKRGISGGGFGGLSRGNNEGPT